jgi:PAS domain S-box-containing protein
MAETVTSLLQQKNGAATIANLLHHQRTQVELSAFSDALIEAASIEDPADLPAMVSSLHGSLDQLSSMADGVDPQLQRRYSNRIAKFGEFVEGPNSIVKAREEELAIIAHGEGLLNENLGLSRLLTEVVDSLAEGAGRDISDGNREVLSLQHLNTQVLIGVAVLSLVSSILIVWLYVGRNLIARLSTLSNSMLAIAGGDLKTSLPTASSDEIGRMAEALAVFRDTAVEVRDTNLREIRDVRRRLVDAIESISEGFSLFDAKDRLVVSNTHYRELLHIGFEDEIELGLSFEDIIRKSVERGTIRDAQDRPDDWVKRRLARHREPSGPHLQQRSDGRWIQISERRTEEGGTVAVYTDITERKRAEEALRESQRQLSTLMANLPGIAYRGGNDRDWSMDFLSEGCYALTGYTSDDLIRHKEVTYADLVHPDDREDLWSQVQAALRDKRPYQVEYRIRAKDDAEKWVWEQGCGCPSSDDLGHMAT